MNDKDLVRNFLNKQIAVKLAEAKREPVNELARKLHRAKNFLPRHGEITYGELHAIGLSPSLQEYVETHFCVCCGDRTEGKFCEPCHRRDMEPYGAGY
jgi:Mn-dependent DtxR family transcriptional regulator